MKNASTAAPQVYSRASLLISLFAINIIVFAGALSIALYVHRALNHYTTDILRAQHIGAAIYSVVSSHLTSARPTNPPNDLSISVRKIGDFLDEELNVEQSVDLPQERIGTDWPSGVRVQSNQNVLSQATMAEIASLTYAEEFFIELSIALAQSPQRHRLIVDLDRSIAIAFEADAWSDRQPLWSVYSIGGVGLVALGLLWGASAIWVSRKVRRLAQAVHQANADQVKPSGEKLSEFRAVEHAIAEIVSANEERDTERINQLAAMSHDLHTPFTRLRLHAEFIKDEQVRTDMLRDLEEIDVMIDESMRFLKREDQREDLQIVDVVSLVQSVCDDAADVGNSVAYRDVLEHLGAESGKTAPVRIWVNARPIALRRAIMNVIKNGVRYGEKSEVRLEHTGSKVRIMIDDPGPGIPKEYWETISLPFKRIETSRSKGTGGVGLGLATAKSVVDSLGGELLFGFTDDGWFRVTLELEAANKSVLRP